jgi:hypothetical protein
VSDALLAQLPDHAVIVGLEVSADLSYVTLWTTTPLSVIGPRGAMAETLRAAAADAVGTPVHFRVELAEGDITDTSPGNGFQLVPQPATAPLPRIPRPARETRGRPSSRQNGDGEDTPRRPIRH